MKNRETLEIFLVLVIIVVVPFVFTIGGIWIGLFSLLACLVALGWDKRKSGPFGK